MTDARETQITDFLDRLGAFLRKPTTSFWESVNFETLTDEMAAIAFPGKADREMVLAYASDRAGKANRVKTLKRLLDLMDNRLEGDGGWPIIPDQTMAEFQEVMSDIGSLIFSKDCDGDSAVTMLSVDRKKYILHYAIEPHAPDGIYDPAVVDEHQATEYLASQMQALKMLSLSTESIARSAENIQNMRRSKLQKTASLKQETDSVHEIIRAGNLDEAKQLIDALVEKYDPPTVIGGKPVPRGSVRRRIPELLTFAIEDYGRAVQKADPDKIAAILADLDQRLDQLAPLVGQPSKAFPDAAKSGVLDEIWRHENELGKSVLQPAIRRYNEMSEEDRVMRRRAEVGK